jgi:hypothetical protein
MHWLDRLYAAAVGRPRFFHDGWGDVEAAGDLLEFVRTPRDPAPIRPDVRRVAHVNGVHVFEGSFESPSAGLPPESREARFELLLPATRADAPVCVYLAATGEEDGSRRRRLALPLVREGIGALLLQNPFYGTRRPARQSGSDLLCVADQFAMNRATIEEGRALLGWLRARGHRDVGVCGYSMGGSIAAYTAVCTPFPVVTIAAAAGSSAATLMTRNVLSRQVHWDRLGEPRAARQRLAAALDAIALHELPRPNDPRRATLVGCRSDGYVDADGVLRLHHHWAGSTLRWIDTGHVAGLTLHGAVLRRAIADTFARSAAV